MMKKIFSLLLLSLLVQSVWSQSGEGYDPENPGDPDLYYTLTLEAAPLSGGTVSPNSRKKLSAGQSAYISASPRLGYEFKCWMMGDSLVSTESSHNFTMPDHDAVLTAYFEWNPVYNPQNPGDPDAEGYSHHVYAYASPSAGGYFNSSSFMLVEGKTTNIYAYPREGYRFESWMVGGKVVSTDNPLTIRMGTEDIAYTATFVYNPVSPGEPSPNVFNATTGEVIIDNFTPGSLNSAIYAAVGSSDNYDAVQSITVIGRMQGSDFGFARSYKNCSLIDLSRTTGYTEVPSYSFEGAEALKELYLPMNVERIGENAFKGCVALTDIYLYATTPPTLGENALHGLGKNISLHVPSASVALYAGAEGWSQLTVQSLDQNEKSITVSLPEEPGTYKNMTLELQNMQSGQVYRCLATDRSSYTFFGLMKNTYYNIYMKNSNNVVLGEISHVALENDNLSVSFSDIQTMHDVTLSVVTPDGQDVTADVTVTWLDAQGSYLRQGNKVGELLTGTNIQYRVKLSKELALEYVLPTDVAYQVKESENDIVLTLSPIKQIAMSGCVKDAATNQGIMGATVSISQVLNGKYSKTVIVKTDSKGIFTATVYNAPTSIAISAYDYVNQTAEVSIDPSAETVTVNDIAMSSIIGATINVNLTYTPSVVEGETAVTQNWYDDYQNVAFSIYNLTTGKEVTQVSVRYPQLVVLDGAKAGDRLRLTARSKKDAFMPVEVEVSVDEENRARITFPIVQKGQIVVGIGGLSVTGSHAMVYNEKGYLAGNYNCSSEQMSIEELDDGKYSLIIMENNAYISTVYSLSQIEQIGLEKDVDYISADVEVCSGVIRNLQMPAIPQLDLNKFRFIDRTKNHAGVNKSTIVAGNYLTVGGNVSFVQDHISEMNDAAIVFDVPEEATFVEKSVLVNGKSTVYTYTDNRLSIPLTDVSKENTVKFCIIPTVKGKYSPTMLANYSVEDKEYLFPIGGMSYHVYNAAITLNEKVATPSVMVKGSALKNSTVKVYDSNSLIGQTKTTSGEWEIVCNLSNVYNLSRHPIYAQITTAENAVYETETMTCIYDKDAMVPKLIKMITPNGTEMIFDFLNLKSNYSGYSVQDGQFSFIAEFTKNDPSFISSVNIYAQTESGGNIQIPASYDEKTCRWVGSHYFTSNDQPINVSMDYTANYESELDLSPLDNNAAETQKLIADEDSVLKVSLAKIDDLSSRLKNGELTANELKEELEYVFVNYYNIEHRTESPEDKQVIDYLNELDGDELNREIENEREKRDHKPSEEFMNLQKQLTTPVNQTIPSTNNVPSITAHTNDAILDTLNNTIHTIDSNWNVTPPESSTVNYSNGKGDVIVADMSEVLPMPANTDEAYREWGERAQRLASENIATIADVANIALDAANLTCANEAARCLREINFNRILIEIKMAHEAPSGFLDFDSYKPFLDDIKNETQNLSRANQSNNTIKSISNVGAGVSAFMGGWSIGSDIRNGLDVNDDWNHLIESINECEDPKAPSLARQAQDHKEWIRSRYVRKGTADVATTGLGIAGAVAGPETLGLSILLLDGGCLLANLCTSHWENEFTKTNKKNWNNVISEFQKLRCEKDEEPEKKPEPKFKPLSISRDPSGYVYEGVSSNRLQGVTATAYYMETTEDMYGVLHDEPRVWDAEEYAQENPLFTDENGMYQWDVPQGLWQVKFEKEGYETTYSEWLPVPPPQLDVNIGMVQSRQPEVKQAHAYKDGVVVEFDKYMLPALLNTENILVSQNGIYVEGEVRMLNEETAYQDENVKYASKMRFVPTTPFTASEVTLTVANRVKSYAGLQMQDSYRQTFDIEQELKAIKAESAVNVAYNGALTLTVQVLPAEASAGKALRVQTSSPMIASIESETVVLDKDGKASIVVLGELPGTAVLRYAIDGYDLTAQTLVNVNIASITACATPAASIASGTVVEKGTAITLTCETEDATIYYTLDGSCPCNETDARKVYDGTPIVINKTMTIKAMAVAPDMSESDVVEFTYIVEGTGIDDVTVNGQIQIYPLPVRDKVNISAGGKAIKSVTISSMNGVVVASANKPATTVTLDVSRIPTGIYIINATTVDSTFSRKILKVE